MGSRLSVLIAVTLGVFCSSIGDVAISQAMKMAVSSGSWLEQARAVLNPYFALGISLHITFMLLYLFALSREQLSFVLPLTALDYVFVTVFAYVWAGEDITMLRWAASLCASGGVALVVKS